MNELDQWCEIDGHVWITYWFTHGLELGRKETMFTKVCQNCMKVEEKIFTAY